MIEIVVPALTAPWIRAHFTHPVTVEEMAAAVRMSASPFQRFKVVTSLSPLQNPAGRGGWLDTGGTHH